MCLLALLALGLAGPARGADYFTQKFDGDNDLGHLMLTFTPNGSGDFYACCVTNITNFPSPPAGGTDLPLDDDGSQQILFTNGLRVSLYGVSYTGLFVNANGNLTLGSGDSAYNPTLSNHFSKPRVAALFDDLDPENQGSVTWKQWSDRVSVTYSNIPESGQITRNDFQVELFTNGVIRLAYLTISDPDGLAGLSRGLGIPLDFAPSDLSAYPSCGTPMVPLSASAIGRGWIAPSGVVWVIAGSNATFQAGAESWRHLADLRTNGASIGHAFGEDTTAFAWTWTNVTAAGTVTVYAVDNLAAYDTPHWWLAQYGWTNDFDAAAEGDADADGEFTWREYVADTDPTNGLSFLRIAALRLEGGGSVIIHPASTGRLYGVSAADHPYVAEWTDLISGVPGTNQALFLEDTNALPRRLYRLKVTLP